MGGKIEMFGSFTEPFNCAMLFRKQPERSTVDSKRESSFPSQNPNHSPVGGGRMIKC